MKRAIPHPPIQPGRSPRAADDDRGRATGHDAHRDLRLRTAAIAHAGPDETTASRDHSETRPDLRTAPVAVVAESVRTNAGQGQRPRSRRRERHADGELDPAAPGERSTLIL